MSNKYRATPQDCFGDYPNCQQQNCSRYKDCIEETEKRNTRRGF